MSARVDALALVDDLLKLGRIREHEARALREGIGPFPDNLIAVGRDPVAIERPAISDPQGKRILYARKIRGLSQRDVARACGVSVQAVSQWENCITAPSQESETALSQLFGDPH